MTRGLRAFRVIATAVGLVVAIQSTASAQLTSFIPAPGQVGLTWYGGYLTIDGIQKSAAYADYLYLFDASENFTGQIDGLNPLTQGGTVLSSSGTALSSHFIGNNLPTNPQTATLSWTKTITLSDLSSIFGLNANPTSGTELVFGLYDANLNSWNFTGDPSRSIASSFYQAATQCIPATTTSTDRASTCDVGMEDLTNKTIPSPSEPDKNDIFFSVTATPEPASLALLGTGLMGLTGVGFIRRRKQSV